MTAQAKTNSRTQRRLEDAEQSRTWSQAVLRHLPAWIILALVMSILLPNALSLSFSAAAEAVTEGNSLVSTIINPVINRVSQPASIAPLFTAEVDRWADDISRWAAEYELDPNLLATVMQIESCGDSTVSSHAGAQGLFQVMPFHFEAGEVYTDPDTNAKRSANFLNQCLGWANGDAGLALACYNGGPAVLQRPFANWPNETQRYYRWGTGIYADASANVNTSASLDSWLGAGGSNLCNRASATQAVQ